MNIDTNKNLLKCFLFRGIEEPTVLKLLSLINLDFREYERSEIIYSPSSFDRRIGIVLSGECSIYRQKLDGKDIPLNVVSRTGCFGITAALAGREEFPTIIIAKRRCQIAFISGSDIEILIRNSSQVALNVIKFMSEKICFLNDKIATFSGDNVEQKTARYILSIPEIKEGYPISFNKKHAAEAINSGRASLYRALDALADSGLISIEEKTIIILDLDGLERISK